MVETLLALAIGHLIKSAPGWFRSLESTLWGKGKEFAGDQVKQRQTEIGVIVRDSHNEPQVRVDHPLARSRISLVNFLRQFDLLLRCQKRNPPDLAHVSV